MEIFFKYSGIIFWALLMGLIILRIRYGKEWYIKFGLKIFFGDGLVNSFKQFYEEFPDKVTIDSVSKLSANVVWRLTRIGFFAILITSLPIILLFQQNRLIKSQNDLFLSQNQLFLAQNEKIDTQIALFQHQNYRIDQQTELLDTQSNLFSAQNVLITDQNSKLDYQSVLFRNQNELISFQNDKIELQNELAKIQNNRIKDQTYLQEADRRGSLIFMLNNVLDKLDEELKLNSDSIRTISPQLTGRIVSLSKAFKPYYYLKKDSLTKYIISPERGQLLLTLINSNLSKNVLNEVYSKGDFSYSELIDTDLTGAYLNNINLRNSDFTGSDLSNSQINNSDFTGSNLSNTNIYNAVIINSKFDHTEFNSSKINRTKFIHTALQNANFKNAQLSYSILDSKIELNIAIGRNREIDTDSLDSFTDSLMRSSRPFTLFEIIDSIKLYKYGEDQFFYRISRRVNGDSIITNFTLEREMYRNINFTNTNLSNTKFVNLIFENSDFSESNITFVDFSNVILKNTYFDKAQIDDLSYKEYFTIVPFEEIGIPLSLNYLTLNADVNEKVKALYRDKFGVKLFKLKRIK